MKKDIPKSKAIIVFFILIFLTCLVTLGTMFMINSNFEFSPNKLKGDPSSGTIKLSLEKAQNISDDTSYTKEENN